MILYAIRHEVPVVTACSLTAARYGVKPGMPVAEARAVAAEESTTAARFERHDPDGDREALRESAYRCGRFSPWTAIDPSPAPDCLFVDLTDCGDFFGGEEKLAERIAREFGKTGWEVRSAVADTIGAAWAFARSVPESSAGNNPRPHIIPPGRMQEMLAPLPVAALRLEPETVAALRLFDIRRIGQLADLPRADLPSRFGPDVLRRLDQAFGRVPEPLKAEYEDETIEVSWGFDFPVDDRRLLEHAVEHLLEGIFQRLNDRSVALQRLLCRWRTADRQWIDMPIGLMRPTVRIRHVLDVWRLHMDRLQPEQSITDVRLRAVGTARLERRQHSLFSEDPGISRGRCFPDLIERLSGRLGSNRVCRPQLVPDPVPEESQRWEPWSDAPSDRRSRPDAVTAIRYRPWSLRTEPLPIRVEIDPWTGDPRRIFWDGRYHTAVQCRGPERIEAGWWRECDLRRDYYIVDTATGRRIWLFYCLDKAAWFLHGVFE